LIAEGQITAQGQGRARRYFAAQAQTAASPARAQELKADAFPSFIPLSADSQDVLTYINQPLQAREKSSV
jgi:hypothetical protein